jgi:hypothetical protein
MDFTNHYEITTESLLFDKSTPKCNSHSSQGQTLESAMNVSAFALTLDGVVTSPQSFGVTRKQRDFAVPGSPVAQSTFSLAMIREAFKGLLVTTERSFSSSAGQRDVLEHSIGHGRPCHGLPIGFPDKTFSFKSS